MFQGINYARDNEITSFMQVYFQKITNFQFSKNCLELCG